MKTLRDVIFGTVYTAIEQAQVGEMAMFQASDVATKAILDLLAIPDTLWDTDTDRIRRTLLLLDGTRANSGLKTL